MKTTYTIVSLLSLSAIVALGGPFAAFIHSSIFGWDSGVFDAGIACFLIGFVAMGMTAGLSLMVQSREDREHREYMLKLQMEENGIQVPF